MLGPELDRAFLLVEKFCDGEDPNPPICPPELIVSRPHSHDERDPTVEMIDGFSWKVKHTARQGRNLTGRSVHVVWWTEAATTSSPMDFVRVRGRVVQSRGQIALDAVPEPRNWVKVSILDASKTESEEAAAAQQRGELYDRTYRVVEMSSRDNPWVSLQEADAFMRDLKRIDARVAAREAGGEWTSDREMLYEYDESKISFDPIDRHWLDFLGLEDCTEQASIRWFTRPHPWIAAVDINAHPHTALIGKLCVKPGAKHDDPRNWIAVFLDVLQLWGMDSIQAAHELAEYRDGLYQKAAIVIDATSTQSRHNAGGALNSARHVIPREAYELAGFEVRGPDRQPNKPSVYRNPDRADSALVTRAILRDARVKIDRRRCQPFLHALRSQEAEPDGITPTKASNTLQDRHIAAFTDVFRYWTWPFFSLPKHTASGESLTVREYG